MIMLFRITQWSYSVCATTSMCEWLQLDHAISYTTEIIYTLFHIFQALKFSKNKCEILCYPKLLAPFFYSKLVFLRTEKDFAMTSACGENTLK